MKKIAVIGHFGFGKNLLNGQTIKTKIVAEALEKQLGKDNVTCVDTHGGIKALVRIIAEAYSILKKHDEIIMLPAHNGLLVMTPALSFFNKFIKKNLHYIVIGGWLPEYLDKHKFTEKLLGKNFKGIYVETSVMEATLNGRGFDNIYIFPNYKDIEPVEEKNLKMVTDFPVKTCFFSRITEKKGISDAIKVVKELNAEAGKTIVTLDIFGEIDDSYRNEFESIMTDSPKYVVYKGGVDFDKTVGTLCRYDLQLFPTKFRTEGIPGSVVESFFAGTPVIASRWNSFDDVIKNNFTGVEYEFENYNDFKIKLQALLCDYEKINKMKKNCIDEAINYRKECREKMSVYFVNGLKYDEKSF